MATTIQIAPGEAVTVAPKPIQVLGDVPKTGVQLLIRKGVLCIDRTLSKADAYMLGMALIAAAGDKAP